MPKVKEQSASSSASVSASSSASASALALHKTKSKSRHGRESSNQATRQRQHFENSFLDFSENHKKELRSVRAHLKRLNDEKQNMQMMIIERNETIKCLKDEIELKNEQMTRLNEVQHQLREECVGYKLKYDDLEQSYSSLEIPYDQNMACKQDTIDQLKTQVETHKLAHIKLMEEFDIKSKEMDSELAEKCHELAKKDEQLVEVKARINELMENFLKLQKDLEDTKQEVAAAKQLRIADYESKIAVLKEELQQKDTFLTTCREEKEELVKSMNKMIEEQSYRVREIERVCGQPLSLVQPTPQRAMSPKYVEPLRRPTPPPTNEPESKKSQITPPIATRATRGRPLTRQRLAKQPQKPVVPSQALKLSQSQSQLQLQVQMQVQAPMKRKLPSLGEQAAQHLASSKTARTAARFPSPNIDSDFSSDDNDFELNTSAGFLEKLMQNTESGSETRGYFLKTRPSIESISTISETDEASAINPTKRLTM